MLLKREQLNRKLISLDNNNRSDPTMRMRRLRLTSIVNNCRQLISLHLT